MFTTSYGNPLTPSTPPHIKANPYVKSENEQFKTFIQLDYPLELYAKEISIQTQTLEEYGKEVSEFMIRLCENSKPNMELYRQQPYLTFSIRLKLIDFLLKMTIRLKILPFVFFRAVKLFDRYCSKRIVLLDQSQLIVVTCLWIASKIQGGNNHFVNLNNNTTKIKTINDIGYGCGGKYLGPTERFRLPKLHELVKLCGAKCKYDASMFKQMELHVLNTLEWSLNEPYVEEFIVQSFEFNNFNSIDNEFFKVKEFLSYLSLYSYELIDVEALELSQVMVDIINETFKLTVNSKDYQVINDEHDLPSIDPTKYRFIKKNLIKSVLSASEYIVKLFNSKGPQYFYHQI
ncbi:cyclin-like protein, partial [Scheffersomyces amazonensis]|uniref:cyclin-like protein n=1 Tax=Scheffersomyces amazonensis TaxID=1078765 RepID=UPI00315DD984